MTYEGMHVDVDEHTRRSGEALQEGSGVRDGARAGRVMTPDPGRVTFEPARAFSGGSRYVPSAPLRAMAPERVAVTGWAKLNRVPE